MQVRPLSSRRGLTLVETMIVVLIVSLLSMVAVPSLRRLHTKAKTTAVVNDLRVFAAAFAAYEQETGRWPVDTEPGVFPPEMAGRIQANVWTRKTAIGGQYDWEPNKTHFGQKYAACIIISSTAAAPLSFDAEPLLAIDKAMDDGGLTTGHFRVGTGLVPLLVIENAR